MREINVAGSGNNKANTTFCEVSELRQIIKQVANKGVPLLEKLGQSKR
jgi:hypothetical protein